MKHSKSSQNALRHGLASGTLLIPGENQAAFESLLTSLNSEWLPTTPTETLLVEDMAKHHWLVERALRLQGEALAVPCEPGTLPPSFAVLLRYQTTNERAFARALKSLQELRKATQNLVSQKEKQVASEVESEVFAMLNRPLPQMDLAAELERIRSGRPLTPPKSMTSSAAA